MGVEKERKGGKEMAPSGSDAAGWAGQDRTRIRIHTDPREG